MRGENEDITWKDDYSKIGRKCLNLLICSCLRACTNTVRNKTPSLVFVVLSVNRAFNTVPLQNPNKSSFKYILIFAPLIAW